MTAMIVVDAFFSDSELCRLFFFSVCILLVTLIKVRLKILNRSFRNGFW
jgi:hypothetical protein